MMGKYPDLPIQKGILTKNYKQKPGRKRFFPAQVCFKKSGFSVTPVQTYHGSADMAALREANAFMVVEGNVTSLKKGSEVEFIFFV